MNAIPFLPASAEELQLLADLLDDKPEPSTLVPDLFGSHETFARWCRAMNCTDPELN